MKRKFTTIVISLILLMIPTTALSFNLLDSVDVRTNEIQREIPPVSLMSLTDILQPVRLSRLENVNTDENDTQEEIPIRIRTFQPFRQWQLTGGYRANVYTDKRTNHIFELGFVKVNDAGVSSPIGFTYYFATDFLFNSQNFSIGPKIGGSVYFLAVTVGSEIVYYTNFRDNTLHWVPYWGIGFGAGRIFMAFHIPIYNRQYPINAISVGLTLPILRLSRKREW